MAINLITGTTQGLGKQLASLLAGGGEVIAINRQPSDDPQAVCCNLSNRADVELTTKNLIKTHAKHKKLTFWLNAAQYGNDVLLRDIRSEAAGAVLYTNVFSQLSMVEAFLDAGVKVKLVAISSSMGSISQSPEPYHYVYGASKAALNLSIRLLRSRTDGLDYLIVDPGWMKTQMGGAEATEDPAKVAADILAMTDEPGNWNRSDGMIEAQTRRIISW